VTEGADMTYDEMNAAEFDRGPTLVLDCRTDEPVTHVGIYPTGVADGIDGGGWVPTKGSIRIRVKGDGKDTVLDVNAATGQVVLR